MSDTSIMSVGDLIDSAFGDPDVNTVNFKLIQTVLLLIARQLSILERFVAVKIGYPIVTSSGSRLSIREVKLHAVIPKKDKKRKKGSKSSGDKDYVVLDGKTTIHSKGKSKEADTRKQEDFYDKSSVDKYGEKSGDESYKKRIDKRKEKDDLSIDEDYPANGRSVSSKGKSAKHKKEFESDSEYDDKSYKTSGKSPEERKISNKDRYENETEERRERRDSKERESKASARRQSRDVCHLRKDETEQRTGRGVEDGSPTKSSRGKSPRDKSARDRSPSSTASEDEEQHEKESRKYSPQEKSRDGKRIDKPEDVRTRDYSDDDRRGEKSDYGRSADKSEGGRRGDKSDYGRSADKSEDGRRGDKSDYGRSKDKSEDGRRGDKSEDDRREDKFEEGRRGDQSDYGRSVDKSVDGRKRDKSDDFRKGDKPGYGRTEDKSEDSGRAKKSSKYSDKSDKTRSRGDKDDIGRSYDKKSDKKSNTEEDFGSSGISLESEQQSVGKSSYDNQDSRAAKRPADKSERHGKGERGGTKVDKASLKGADSRVSGTATADSKRKKYQQLLEKLEEERERVLRVIHQRTDSHEEHSKSPTPMASLSSTDLQHEKLLIVEKVSSDTASKGKDKSKWKEQTKPRMSVVTQDQFQQLMQTVKDLEGKFGPLDIPFLEDLRQGVPITDALAGLQLASRLEATEKALGQMINIVTDIAGKTPGVNVKSFTDLKEEYGGTVTKLRGTESQYKFRTKPTPVLRVEIGDKPGWVSNTGGDTESKMKAIGSKPSETVSVISAPISVAAVEAPDNTLVETSLWDVTKKNFVTAEEMEIALKNVYDDYTTILTNWTNRTSQKADEAFQKCTKMESELAKSIAVERKMNDLEEKIQSYVERINILDTGLSTQMINYQEQLTQMQHDLETGLDNMAEALATQTGDTEAMAELNQNFTILQSDFDRTRVMQKDLSDIQEAFAIDLTALKKQIEMLREVKSDRDEVTDALRDKAGLSALNGLVTQMQFDAVQGDLEKRIRHAYDKFNSQEVVWQKAIDDLIREINEKATVQQVDSLREEIQSKINVLKDKLDYMLDLLGEPSAAAVKRQLFRDTECLSCSTPAKMKMAEDGMPEPVVQPEPVLPYKKAAGEGTGMRVAVGDGDHVPCIPEMPPPHPIDPRAEFCTRYCGGRIFSQAFNRAAPTQLPNINISQLTRETRTALGDDGKVYKVGYEVKKKPCHPCNVPKSSAKDDNTPEREKISVGRKSSSTMGTPSDLRVYSDLMYSNRQKGSDTPPAYVD